MNNKDESKELWLKYHSSLRSFIRRRVPVKELAEDILQIVFLKIVERRGDLEKITNIEGWLYRLTRNSIIDFYRSNKTSVPLPDWVSEDEITSSELARSELARCLFPMISRLPEKYGRALMFSDIEGMSQRQVAELEKLSLSGAKSRIQRGRVELKKMLLRCCEIEINTKNQLVSVNAKGACADCC